MIWVWHADRGHLLKIGGLKIGSILVKKKEKRLQQLNHRVNNDVSVVSCYFIG